MTFRKLEILLSVLAILSIIAYLFFKVNFLKYVYSFSLIILSITYFGFSWLYFSERNGKYLAHSVFSGILYSITLVGILFWLNEFLGYNPLLLISSFFLLLVLLPLGIQLRQKAPKYFNLHISRSTLLGVVSAIIYFSDWV